MKHLNFIFDFLLFPFLFLMRFILSQGQHTHSHRGRWERGKLILLPFMFASLLQAADTCPTNDTLITSVGRTTTAYTGFHNDTIVDNNDADYYKVVITSRTKVQINVNKVTNKKTKFLLLEDDCTTAVSGTTKNAKDYTVTKTLDPGTYYAKVFHSQSSNVQYKIHARLPDISDLQIVKIVDKSNVNIGETVTFTLTATNDGPESSDVIITDPIPNGFINIAASDNKGNFDCSVTGNNVSCSGSNGLSTSETFIVTVTAEASTAGTYTNTANVVSAEEKSDPDLSNNSASVDITVSAPPAVDEITSFSAPSTVTEGETITVSVSYNVSETREIVTGFQQNHAPWQGWNWTTVTVPAGIGTVDISFDIPTGQPLGNGYQIPIVLQPVGGNWNTRLDSKAQNPVTLMAGSRADLSLTEFAAPNPDPIDVGSDVTFSVRANNSGPDHALPNIVLNTTYDQDVTLTSLTSPGDFSCSPSAGTLTSGTPIVCTKTSQMNNGAPNKDFTFVVQPSASGTLTQTSIITSATQDPDNTNNELNSSVTVSLGSCGDTSGLSAKYYNNETWSGTPVLERNDKTVAFNWGNGSPGSGVNSDHFSVQWTGFIQIPENGNYTFSFLHDDAFEVWIDGVSIYQYNTWSGNAYRNASTKYFSAGCHTIELKVAEGSGGASAWMKWRNDVSIGSSVTVPESNLWTNITLTGEDNANDLCYDSVSYTGPNTCYDINGDFIGGQGCTETILIANNSRTSLTSVTAGLSISGISGSDYSDCGIAGSSGSCSHTGWINYGSEDTLNQGITFAPLSNYATATDAQTIYVTSDINSTFFKGDNLFGSYTKDGTAYRGKINPCISSYCKAHGLGEGFHIVDPDGGDDINSYEIYCDRTTYNGRDLIDLPLKNDYNNFVFEDDSPSSNYYNEADAAKTDDAGNEFYHLQIRINADSTISVAPESIAEDSEDNKGYFSNINLIGTPFYIDASNTTLSNCDASKLRKGSDDQAWKINTLDYTNGRCKVESMKLKLLNDYHYLTFPDIDGGDEILEETCRKIFEKVPDATGYLPSAGGQSDGYFWIDPDQGGRGSNDTLDTLFRPIIAYCKYQDDISQAWTFVMALDGKVTNSKNDIKTMDEVRANPSIYHDTCSQLGLLFYVPNTKDTFERTRKYLYDQKAEWIHYTGTIREKYKMYKNNPGQEYYIPGEGYNEIWPYGPFGLYFPQRGNRDVNGSNMSWYPGSTSTKGNMSSACMNSGVNSQAATCTDHASNMGDLGWRTTLEDQVAGGLLGINNGDQFWIADVGAGNYLTKSGTGSNGLPEYSVTGPGQGGTASAHRTPYYEPNGNYTQFAWLNFIADSNGNIYHNDDNNAFYSYYDYMCMAWDNYRDVTRIVPIEGPFTAIDQNISNQPVNGMAANLLDFGITTKIAKRDMDLQIVTFNKTYTASDAVVDNNQSINAGVFLTYITTSGSDDVYNEDRYFGDIGGLTPSLTINSNGYHTLTSAEWGGNKSLPEARRKMQVRFKYCQYNQDDWTSCWAANNICLAGCDPENVTCNCKYASSDFFAVRPKEFSISGITEDPELLRSGRTYTFPNIRAVDDLGSSATAYDQFGSNIEQNSTLYLANDIADAPAPNNILQGTVDMTTSANFDFTNGVSAGELNVTYDDVAKINVELYDNDWASIDSSDSPDICNNTTPPYGRRICSQDTNVTFIVDHFELTDINLTNYDDRLTYLTYNSDLNMSATLGVTIKAKNDNDDITQNFISGAEYYENPVELNITSIPKAYLDDNVTELQTVKKDIAPAMLLGFGSPDANGTHSISPRIDENTSQRLLFNYNKILNKQQNPFDVNGSTISMAVSSLYTSSSGATANITGIGTGDGNATFYYAKIRAGKAFYEDITEDSVQTPILISIYCDLPTIQCDSFGLNTINADTDESNWYRSIRHQQNRGDGNITLRVASSPYEGNGNPVIDTQTYPGGANIIIMPNSPDSGEKNATIGSGVGPSLPMTVGIEIVRQSDPLAPPYTHGWLVHNPDSTTNFPSPLYKVRFIGAQADWSGVGTTGHAIDVNISDKKTHRMDW